MSAETSADALVKNLNFYKEKQRNFADQPDFPGSTDLASYYLLYDKIIAGIEQQLCAAGIREKGLAD